MISVNLRIRNPFRAPQFRNIWNSVTHIKGNKYLEAQISYYAFNWVELSLDLNWRQTDHAGPWLTVNLLGLTLDVRIYDQRRWDNERDCWATD